MATSRFISQTLDYGRELVQAGMNGLRAGEILAHHSANDDIKASARHSLPAAAVGGSLALLACTLISKRRIRVAPILVCSTAAFCADFIVRTRDIRSKMIQCAEKEMSKVRDQHWLASHPIDYA